jgi:hypothetical protein
VRWDAQSDQFPPLSDNHSNSFQVAIRVARHLATTDGYRLLQGGFGVNRRLAVTMNDQVSGRLAIAQ